MADFKSTLAKIKSRGYWKVNMYPAHIQDNARESLAKTREIVQTSSILLRGWDYPHFPVQGKENQGIYVGENNSIEAWIDWEKFKEVWRFYTNGQFIHIFALREDWWREDNWISEDHPLRKIEPGSILDVLHAVYSLTEIYTFFGNLITNMPDIEEFIVEISLIGTHDRTLFVSDFLRAPLFANHQCKLDEVKFPQRKHSREALIANFLDIALEDIIYLFNSFNWDNPNIPVIKEDQKKLLERRI